MLWLWRHSWWKMKLQITLEPIGGLGGLEREVGNDINIMLIYESLGKIHI